MMRVRSLGLAAAALVLLVAGLWLTLHRSGERGALGGGSVFSDLTAALDDVNEIRLSKGDGSRVTLRREASGWQVDERNYPADPGRVRELALGLARMQIVEHKTSDPANYPKLGVEDPDTPTATGTLLQVVAGEKTWSLIVGKNAEGRAIYVRKPGEAASALAEPAVTVDPDPKRWLDRQLADIEARSVHEISVQPASGPAYRLTRPARDADLALSPVPKGREPASSMSLDAQAATLTSFNFDDMRAAPAAPAPATDHATWRLFDGQVIEFAGRKEGDKAYVTVVARRDAALAAQFPAPPPPADATPAEVTTSDTTAADASADAAKPVAPAAAPEPEPADQTVERLAARAAGLEYEIPLYKYESLFRKHEDLLAPKS